MTKEKNKVEERRSLGLLGHLNFQSPISNQDISKKLLFNQVVDAADRKSVTVQR